MSTKPTATLTDVKNKTGDVFALAEKNGAVVITSYNKPKYVICKFSVFEDLQKQEETKPETKMTVPEVKPESIVTPVPELPVDNPIEAAVPSFEIKIDAPKKSESKPEPKVEPKVEAKKPAKPAPKANTKDLVWWDRKSNLEQNWVRSVKSLL